MDPLECDDLASLWKLEFWWHCKHPQDDPTMPTLEESVLARLTELRSLSGGDGAEARHAPASTPDTTFVPREPSSFRAADLTDSEVEALVLKFLLSRGDAAGRDIADQVKLPFVLVDQLLRQMKVDQLLVHRGSAPMNDYQYHMSDLGVGGSSPLSHPT